MLYQPFANDSMKYQLAPMYAGNLRCIPVGCHHAFVVFQGELQLHYLLQRFESPANFSIRQRWHIAARASPITNYHL